MDSQFLHPLMLCRAVPKCCVAVETKDCRKKICILKHYAVFHASQIDGEVVS